MLENCGPIFRAEDFVKYMANRRKLSRIYIGDILVVTPINHIHHNLIKFFNARPCREWVYEPEKFYGIHVTEVSKHTVGFMVIASGAPQVTTIEEAIVVGIKQIIFIGLAGGLDVNIGDFVVPYGAICEEGFSQHYIPYGIPIEASRNLYETMLKACRESECRVYSGRVWTISAPYRELKWKAEEYYKKWECRAVDMETGAVYALATYYNVGRIALLVISDIIYPYHKFSFHSRELKESIEKIPTILKNFLISLK